MSLFEHAIHIFEEIAVHVAGHVISHKAMPHGEGGALSAAEHQYLEVRGQLSRFDGDEAGNTAVQKQRLALEKQALAVQTELSRKYLAHLRSAQQVDIKARVEKIQADYDNQHWAGVLSRQETLNLLSQTAASQARLLMVVSRPDVSESCPSAFRHDLGREVCGKLKGFVEKHYPARSDYAVEFFGKFFKADVFDAEIKQLENVLAPLISRPSSAA